MVQRSPSDTFQSSIEIAVKEQAKAGTRMTLHFATPSAKATAKLPAILVLQEAFGVNAHIRDVVRRFASLGFVAVAPELFHRTAPPGFQAKYDIAAVREHLQAVTRETLTADLAATHAWLAARAEVDADRIASIGYCLGGRASFVANALLPLRAAISYYGGRIVPDHVDLVPRQNSPLLFFWGGKDSHIPVEDRKSLTDSLTSAKKPFVNVEFSEADHGFFCDERKQYHAPSARQSWVLTQQFLRDHLGLS